MLNKSPRSGKSDASSRNEALRWKITILRINKAPDVEVTTSVQRVLDQAFEWLEVEAPTAGAVFKIEPTREPVCG